MRRRRNKQQLMAEGASPASPSAQDARALCGGEGWRRVDTQTDLQTAGLPAYSWRERPSRSGLPTRWLQEGSQVHKPGAHTRKKATLFPGESGRAGSTGSPANEP